MNPLIKFIDIQSKQSENLFTYLTRKEIAAVSATKPNAVADVNDSLIEKTLAQKASNEAATITAKRKLIKQIKQNYILSYTINLRGRIFDFREDQDVTNAILCIITSNRFDYYHRIKYIDPNIKKNKDLCLAAVNKYGLALKDFDSTLKKDKDVCLAAIKQDYGVLEFVDDKLKKDKDICMAAITQCYCALAFVTNEYNCSTAIRQIKNTLQFVDNEFKKDKDECMDAIMQRERELVFGINELEQNDNELFNLEFTLFICFFLFGF